MTGKRRNKGMDVRVREWLLDDPVLLNLSGGAFAALIVLQVWSVRQGTYGHIDATAYTAQGIYHPGLPWVTPETLPELEDAGLIWDWTTTGLTVTWEWQTTAGEMDARADYERTRKAAQRATHKATVAAEALERLEADHADPSALATAREALALAQGDARAKGGEATEAKTKLETMRNQ